MEEKETRFDRSTERSECLIAEYKKLRKDEAKMSQKSLEDITGVPRQMIIRYEKGKIMPTVRAMNRLLEPLGYQLGIVPLKKEDIEEFLRFAEKEGYADETMQIKSIELSRQGLEHTADMQQREITQKCRLSVGLGAMSGLLILLLLV